MNARRVEFCADCKTETQQMFAGSQNGSHPRVDLYACLACRRVLKTFADVTDADGFVASLVETFARRHGQAGRARVDVFGLDRVELEADLRVELWAAFLTWKPERNARFRSYAAWKLHGAIVQRLREEYGDNRTRDGRRTDYRKPHVGAASIEGERTYDRGRDGAFDDDGSDRLEYAVGSGTCDPRLSGPPTLAGTLARRDRQIARALEEMGLSKARRAS